MTRGEVWLADLGPIRHGEIAGRRPVLVFQNDAFATLLLTVVIIPFTTNLRLAKLPTCLLVARGEGGLASDSVALCHQLRALDPKCLLHRLGALSAPVLNAIQQRVALALVM